jgi:hypothetical protein
MTQTLIAPAGCSELHDLGIRYRPAADGTVVVPDVRVSTFLNMGCSQLAAPIQVTTTAKRPTSGLFAGMPTFDTTLNKPIWRNAASTGWVDATGGAV